eukprot:TRINITY_DN17586_c0_g1_i1.p2 TRINITY_DN17586_c0_g1~~TRINITY_DN17586_c0_g1_i1.p2  ORF type:complete len:52 (+),score=3.82 TRINITY_DN17586_c0_g1_i1:133-288(+)
MDSNKRLYFQARWGEASPDSTTRPSLLNQTRDSCVRLGKLPLPSDSSRKQM